MTHSEELKKYLGVARKRIGRGHVFFNIFLTIYICQLVKCAVYCSIIKNNKLWQSQNINITITCIRLKITKQCNVLYSL